MPHTRQLVAIMFTDIQGYTAIMQRDEELGIKMRDKHREIFNKITEKYKGAILQYFGDGTLSTFKSAIDAVKCAMEMQLAFQQEPVIPVRIGIHLGDIVFTEDDIIGDGVNVASRIESLAVPGSVFISDKVYDEIKNQSSIETQSLRTFELKNVDKPIEVFAISNKGLIIPNVDEISRKLKDTKPGSKRKQEKKQVKVSKHNLSRILYSMIVLVFVIAGYFIYQNSNLFKQNIDDLDKSIAVLAFENMSVDPSQEYFSDGISEEILNSLVQVEGLKVAGRTSSFSFKGKDADIQTIGNKLGVSLVLEGSVRKSEDRLRITAQLINAKNGYHIWSEKYDREMKDIFDIQEEIAIEIVNLLKFTVLRPKGPGPRTYYLRSQPTNNLEAYDYYLKGIYALSRDVEGTVDARNYFQKAIDLDPDFAQAYAGLGDAFLNHAAYGIVPANEALTNARKAAIKSISLDNRQAYGHKVLAYVYMFFDWDWDTAKSEYEKAIELGLENPDHFITWYDAFLYENYDKAIEDAKTILKRSPLSVEDNWHLGVCYLMADHYESAIEYFKQTLVLDSNYSEGYRWLGKTYRLMERYEESLTAFGKSLEMTQGKGPAYFETIITLAHAGYTEEANLMVDSNFIQNTPPGAIASVYANMGRLDEAFELLEQCLIERSMTLISIRALSDFDIIRDDPRYEKLIEQINFPK